jgi:hypothetical protein
LLPFFERQIRRHDRNLVIGVIPSADGPQATSSGGGHTVVTRRTLNDRETVRKWTWKIAPNPASRVSLSGVLAGVNPHLQRWGALCASKLAQSFDDRRRDARGGETGHPMREENGSGRTALQA